MTDTTTQPRLILPVLGPFYQGFAQPWGWLVFRLVIGGFLIVAGWPKMAAPMGMAGFMEYLGFAPGWLFSPLVAGVEFFGGLLIVLGLFTRPAALAAAVVLAGTWWFHTGNPWGPEFLTPEGIAYLSGNLHLLTPAGQQNLLPDGGAGFLSQAQQKAEMTSLFWALGAALIAAFGAGRLSLDRLLGREF